MLTTIDLNSDSDSDFEENEEKKCEVKEKPKEELGLVQGTKIAYQVLKSRDVLRERIAAVGKEFKHPLKRMSTLTQSLQQEWQALQNQEAQSIKAMWDCFFEQLSSFITHFDGFLATSDKPDLGTRTAKLIQEALDLLDQVKFLNLQTLVNQFLPKSMEHLQEHAEAVLIDLYQKRIFPQIEKSLSQIQNGGLHLPAERFKNLSYFEQDAILLGMEFALKLFEEAALMADQIELQFCLREGSLSSRIFPEATGTLVEKKTTEKKPEYDLLFIIEDEARSPLSEKDLEKLSKKHRKSPILIKRGEKFNVFGNLNGIWSIGEFKNTSDYDYIRKLKPSKSGIAVPSELYPLLQAFHAPLPSLRETIAQTYTTLAKKYEECMKLAGYQDKMAIELYPYPKAVARQRKKISDKLAAEIEDCQQQAAALQEKIKEESEAAVDKLLRKKNPAGVPTLPYSNKKEKKVEKDPLGTFKKNLPTISLLPDPLTVDQAENAHSEAVAAYKYIIKESKILKIRKQAVAAPYKAWEKLTLTLAQLVTQKSRVDKLNQSLSSEEKSTDAVGLDDLSLEAQNLYLATQALIKSLLGKPEKSGDASAAVAAIKERIMTWEKKLESSMDEDIYSLYITKSDSGEEKRIKLSSHWLAQLSSGLSNIKKTTEVVESLIKKSEEKQDEYATPASNMQARMQNTQELLNEVAALTLSFDELRKKFNDKDQKVILLEVPTQFRTYVSEVPTSGLADFEGFSNTLITKIKEKLNAHSLFNQVKELKKCQTAEAFFEMITQNPLEVSLQPIASQAVKRGMKLVRDYQGLTADYLSPPGMAAKVRFAFQHFSAFNALKNEIEVLEEPLRLAYQEAGLKHAIDLNNFFRQLFLWIDELEMQFFLKEGFLANRLRPYMEDFNQQLANLGYEFLPEGRYPYTEAILQQRHAIWGLDEEKQSAPQKTLKNKRIEQAKTQSKLEKKTYEAAIDKLKKKHETRESELIDAAIRQRIIELKRKWQLFSDTAGRKIKLLEKLLPEEKKTEEEAPTANSYLQERLEKLKNDPDYYLLFEGQTGRCLRAWKYHGATHSDLIMELNSELDRLRSKQENWFFFRTRLQETITACEKLRDLLDRTGYSLKEALDDLKAIDSPSYQLLLKHENALLQKIRTIEKHIPEELRPKKQILLHSIREDEKKVNVNAEIIAHIDREIRLLKERRYEAVTFFAQQTKIQLELSIGLLIQVKEDGNTNFTPNQKALLKKFVPILLKKLTPPDGLGSLQVKLHLK